MRGASCVRSLARLFGKRKNLDEGATQLLRIHLLIQYLFLLQTMIPHSQLIFLPTIMERSLPWFTRCLVRWALNVACISKPFAIKLVIKIMKNTVMLQIGLGASYRFYV